MSEHAAVIVGAGPTGLMLAGELALAQVDVAIVERRAGQDLSVMNARRNCTKKDCGTFSSPSCSTLARSRPTPFGTCSITRAWFIPSTRTAAVGILPTSQRPSFN